LAGVYKKIYDGRFDYNKLIKNINIRGSTNEEESFKIKTGCAKTPLLEKGI
jgi:hypothetical protein